MLKLVPFFIVCFLVSCGKHPTRISPNCRLMKTDTGYVFTVNWEFVNDTIFDVKQIGKKDSWVYVYGNYGQLHKPCWLHIADYGDIVKHYCRWVENEVSHYGRQNADMYIPEEAIDKLACSN